jgi:hypothetical protein
MSKALSASLGVPSSPGTYSAALEGLTGVNEVLMRRDPSIPPLYSTGTRWELRPGDPSETMWRYAPDVATQGWGDCQDLSAYRAAELRVSGADPQASVRVYPTGPNRYHAVVARGDGSVEDPSVILGMNPVPEAPMSTQELPAVAGLPGDPISPVNYQGMIRQNVRALHPNAVPDISGPGFLGEETGRGEKIARIKDVAPEITGPTFHVAPHRVGSVCGFKGIHRVPLKDGTAIVGMTHTYNNPTDCIGDGAGLISSIGNAILNHPIVTALLGPTAYAATAVLNDPGVRTALSSTAKAAKAAASGNSGSGDGWGDLSVTGAAAPAPRSGNFLAPGSVPVRTSPGPTTQRGVTTNPSAYAAAQAVRQGTSPTTINPQTGLPYPPGVVNPTTGQPYPGAINPQTGQPYATAGYPGQYPGMYNPYGTINPMTGQPFPPGTTPLGMQSAFQAAQSPAGGYDSGGYSSDYGIPSGPSDPGTSYGGSFAADYGLGLPDYDSSALSTYTDPGSQLGYWNT